MLLLVAIAAIAVADAVAELLFLQYGQEPVEKDNLSLVPER